MRRDHLSCSPTFCLGECGADSSGSSGLGGSLREEQSWILRRNYKAKITASHFARFRHAWLTGAFGVHTRDWPPKIHRCGRGLRALHASERADASATTNLVSKLVPVQGMLQGSCDLQRFIGLPRKIVPALRCSARRSQPATSADSFWLLPACWTNQCQCATN